MIKIFKIFSNSYILLLRQSMPLHILQKQVVQIGMLAQKNSPLSAVTLIGGSEFGFGFMILKNI